MRVVMIVEADLGVFELKIDETIEQIEEGNGEVLDINYQVIQEQVYDNFHKAVMLRSKFSAMIVYQ